jgi:phosphatidylglycerol:prolipoprotein diacylglycerol transferase
VQFPNFDPYLPFLHFGAFGVRWYAVAYIVGIVLGWAFARRLVQSEALWAPRPPPVTKLQLDDLVLWITLGVIGGGRLGYVLFYNIPGALAGKLDARDSILANPLELFQLWHGGMSFHGGALGVIVAVLVYALKNRIAPLRLGDLIAPCVPIGLFFGRIANFINGELWGRPTHLPWGMVFCNQTILNEYHGSCPAGAEPRHPSQLYEAGLEGLVLFAVLWLAVYRFRLLEKPGQVTGVFLIGYGLARFSLEQVREPDGFMPDALRGVLTMGMVLSLPMMAVGAWLLWRANRAPAGEMAQG